LGSKNDNDEANGWRKKFDNIFSRLDTIHERDGQTGGQTPAVSKDRRDLTQMGRAVNP